MEEELRNMKNKMIHYLYIKKERSNMHQLEFQKKEGEESGLKIIAKNFPKLKKTIYDFKKHGQS